jgi:predicted nucleotide-binding protein
MYTDPLQENAKILLKLMVEADETGDKEFENNWIKENSELSILQINDAISYLKDAHAVDVIEEMGTHPFNFSSVRVNHRGRNYYDEIIFKEKNQGIDGVDTKIRPDVSVSKDPKKVFVVHGRNEAARKAIFEFLRAVGLNPIEWSQAVLLTGKPAPYIGEILENAFSEAQAVVVLLTGDDEAKLKEEFLSQTDHDYEKNLTAQARPNVLFEAGMAFGRHADRTILIEIGNLRPFSDIAGRNSIRINNSVAKRQELAQRLTIAECSVDISGIDWHTAGNFEVENMSNKGLKAQEATEPADDVLASMPQLVSEMQSDLLTPKSKFTREFFVLPNHQVCHWSGSKPRFAYYEDDHQNLLGQIDLLEAHGFLKNVTPPENNALIYRMTEKLVSRLCNDTFKV